MAGVSMKDIKSRIKSMESTKQITKAMEMVASSKLRSAQMRAIASRPYFEALYETLNDIAAQTPDFVSPFLTKKEGKTLFIVIAGDRGLAGGYNSSVLKLAYAQMDKENTVVLPVGKKAVEFFSARKMPLWTDTYTDTSLLTIGECYSLSNLLSKAFLHGEFSSIRLAYTNFVSLLMQSPGILDLLPMQVSDEKDAKPGKFILYEPGASSVFNSLVPEYIGGVLYGALCESVASEHASRRMAMDSATKNAEDMISDLALKYNRARQGAITQEITEIVAGAENT